MRRGEGVTGASRRGPAGVEFRVPKGYKEKPGGDSQEEKSTVGVCAGSGILDEDEAEQQCESREREIKWETVRLWAEMMGANGVGPWEMKS